MVEPLMTDNGNQIVLIEDDADMREAVRLMLEPEGFEVRGYPTGSEGLEAMRAHPPDLVLLDIMLAEPTEGFHIAYAMRGDEALRDIPIVMISAIGERMGMDFARDLGSEYVPADAFLEKPIEAAVLRQTIEGLLSGKG
jgi:CheY-like chemotaxis protein